jgi:hypothetical protein
VTNWKRRRLCLDPVVVVVDLGRETRKRALEADVVSSSSPVRSSKRHRLCLDPFVEEDSAMSTLDFLSETEMDTMPRLDITSGMDVDTIPHFCDVDSMEVDAMRKRKKTLGPCLRTRPFLERKCKENVCFRARPYLARLCKENVRYPK